MLLGKKTIGTIARMGGVMSVPDPFAWSWAQMVEFNCEYVLKENERIDYARPSFSYHSLARNELCKKIRGDWILMLDTDHQFEPDLAARMIDRMTKYDMDVLSGLYFHKYHPRPPVLYRWNAAEKAMEIIADWDDYDGEYFIPIDSAGAGCLMIRRRVLERIENEIGEEPFAPLDHWGEDHSFFLRLMKLGIKSYCDPSIECHHLAYEPLTLKNYEKSKNAK
jgi:glycosyltransferase involved in cell wall biosynthesis